MLIAAANAAAEKKDYSEILAKIEKKHRDIIDGFELPFSIVEKGLKEFESVVKSIEEGAELTLQTMDLVQSFGERIAWLQASIRTPDVSVGWNTPSSNSKESGSFLPFGIY